MLRRDSVPILQNLLKDINRVRGEASIKHNLFPFPSDVMLASFVVKIA